MESGLEQLKRGSKGTVFICLGTRTGLVSFLENHGFDPFLSHLWSQIGPFSRPCQPSKGPKLLNMGSKWAHSTCLCTPITPKVSLEKPIFDRFLIDFWSQNNPCSGDFVTLEGPKWLAMGSKRAGFTCLGTPNGLGSTLEKHIVDSFVTHFLSQNSPFSRHFGILGGPKRTTTHSKWAKSTCFGIPCGPGSFFEKRVFFCTRWWTLLTYFGTRLFGLPLAACRSPLGLGTGV